MTNILNYWNDIQIKISCKQTQTNLTIELHKGPVN